HDWPVFNDHQGVALVSTKAGLGILILKELCSVTGLNRRYHLPSGFGQESSGGRSGKLGMSKRTPEERAELERRRVAGYQKLTLPERRAAARKAARSRRWFKAPAPTIKDRSDMTEPSPVLDMADLKTRAQDLSPRSTNKPEPAKAL